MHKKIARAGLDDVRTACGIVVDYQKAAKNWENVSCHRCLIHHPAWEETANERTRPMNAALESSMLSRFRTLNLNLRPAAGEEHHHLVTARWFGLLSALYSDPARHYHHLGHIENLLDRLDDIDIPFASHGLGLAVQVAAWFHDAIYIFGEAKPGTNEQVSAGLAMSFLCSIGFHTYPAGTDFMMKVQKAIVATTHGPGVPEEEAARLMVDLDLAGFADPWEQFQGNNLSIRKEFAGASDEAYRWGRLKFLGGLMARPVIFHRLVDLEVPARRNIERHMKDLLADRL